MQKPYNKCHSAHHCPLGSFFSSSSLFCESLVIKKKNSPRSRDYNFLNKTKHFQPQINHPSFFLMIQTDFSPILMRLREGHLACYYDLDTYSCNCASLDLFMKDDHQASLGFVSFLLLSERFA